MTARKFFTFFLIFSYPLTAFADISADDLPENLVWYMHADLQQMRSSESGGLIYSWFEEELFAEIEESIGLNLNEEIDSVTAFSGGKFGSVVIVNGSISKRSQEKILALATLQTRMNIFESDGKAYYHIRDDSDDDKDDDSGSDHEQHKSSHEHDGSFDDFDGSAYFSFAVPNKAIITSDEGQMKDLLESGGTVAGGKTVNRSMFLLTADRTFVQAGIKPGGLIGGGSNGGIESNILRNTEKAALLVSDAGGRIAVEVQLVSTDAKMAASVGSIVSGLISLASFNADLEPAVIDLIQNTKVDVKNNILSLSMVIDPELILEILDD